LDINPKAIAKAKELFQNQQTFLFNQQGIAILYKDTFFDVVILIATMKHIIQFEDCKPLYDELNHVSCFVMVIEVESKENKMEKLVGEWEFYNSNWEEGLAKNFNSSIQTVREASDFLGL
jgi:succinylarginine dihydrolase